MEKIPSRIDVEYECWKRFMNIFSTTKYCGICLETKNELCELEAEHFQIFAGSEADGLSLKEILSLLFENSVQNLIHSGFICTTCKDSAINSYVFINHTKKNADIFNLYLRQLDSKIDQVYKHCLNQRNEQKTENALIVIEKPIKTVQFGTNLLNQSMIKNEPEINNHHNIEDDDYNIQDDDYNIQDDDYNIEDDNQSDNIGDININTISPVSQLILPEIDNLKPTNESIQRKENVQKRDDGKSACNICHKLFKDKALLRQHKVRIHIFGSRTRNYTCLVCQFKCVDTTGLRAHMLIHDANKDYRCKICSVDFDSRRQYLQHARSLSHRAKANPKILEHYKMKRRNFKCSVCQIEIFNNKSFSEHMSTHGPDEMHKCVSCDMEFDSRRKYLLHQKTVKHYKTSGIRQKMKCKFCDYTSYLPRAMKGHFQSKHLAIPFYECFICKKKLMTPVTLQKHIERHSVRREKKEKKDYSRECDVCGRVLGGHTAFKKHMRLHTGERPYQCHLCDMGFICKSEVTMHIYRKHTEKSVTCPLCDLKFHTISNMRMHVKKVHWKRREKFDFRKLEGLSEADYGLFQDRRKIGRKTVEFN